MGAGVGPRMADAVLLMEFMRLALEISEEEKTKKKWRKEYNEKMWNSRAEQMENAPPIILNKGGKCE